MDSSFLPESDQIEVARSTLACLCQMTGNTIHEIHINRIQDIWSRSDFPPQFMKDALEDVKTLREVEHLGKGYWLPTPTRLVSLNSDTSLLVSTAPTTELQRHFSSVRRAGLGRLVATTQVSHLPMQSMKSWRGASDLDTAASVRTLITLARNDFHPSILTPDIEAFSVKPTKSVISSSRRIPAWVSIKDRQMLAWTGVSLFRSRLSAKRHRYFLGKLTSKREFLEGPAILDNLSMQYGLASLLGKPLTVFIRKQANSFQINLPLMTPITVRRLLKALCEAPLNSFGYSWICHQFECEPTITLALQNLGSEIVTYE